MAKHKLGTALSLLAVFAVIGFFLKYSPAVSSQKVEAEPAVQIRPSGTERQIGTPVSDKAISFSVSIPVRDMPSAALSRSGSNRGGAAVKVGPSSKDQPVRGAEEPGRVKPDDLMAEVPHLISAPNSSEISSSMHQSSLLTPQTLPTPSVSFEGISVFDTVPLGQGFLPPDTTGEAGPNHFVQAVNVGFRVWDRTGNPLTPTISLGTLFAAVPGPCAANLGGSPNVIYDQLADRWLITQRCDAVRPWHDLVAISKTGDPTGVYYLYDFVMPNTKAIDSPKFGVWSDGYYMGYEQFDGQFFEGAAFVAFDRAKMLMGDPTAGFVHFDSCPLISNCTVVGGIPADIDGFIPPAPGTPGMFALYTADEYQDPQGDGLRLFDLHADFTTPSNSTLTERVGSPLPVAAFDPEAFFIPEPMVDISSYLDKIMGLLMYRVAYRNFGNGTESLLINHSVDGPEQNHIGVRYYQLNRTTASGPFVIAEQQSFSPDASQRWMGSGAMNYLGDTAIGYSVSSTTVYPSIRYAARLATDPPGTGLAQGEQTIIDGGGSQYSTTRRWGDYSQMSVDPVDDCSFWYTQEYYAASNTNGWQTRIAKFAPRPCTVSPRGTISGTVTSCATGNPVAGILVDAGGGLYRITGADGSYSLNVSPGTYTLSPRRVGYSIAPITGIVVANGGTSTQNFCVAPVTVLGPPVTAITSGNNLLEPNECNTLNLPLTNVGAADATGVTATLASNTPGVTIVSGTSTYANITANGGVRTNNTPFSIRTDNSVACLSTVNLTLTVNFNGSGSPIVLNIPILVGKPSGPDYVFTASTGATITTTGTLVPGSQGLGVSTHVFAPFAFTLYGKPVAAGDPLAVDTNGVVEVTQVNGDSFPINHPLPSGEFVGSAGVLFPWWEELTTESWFSAENGIFTETTGTAPNRTLKIEWRARKNDQLFLPPDTDFAVLFHENSDSFDYVYVKIGTTFGLNGGDALVGVQGLNYGNNFTQYSYRQPVITPGMKLTASRPAVVCSAGTGTCAQLAAHTRFDFEGDGKADISVFRPSTGDWFRLNSSDGAYNERHFGLNGDRTIPADFDGDGKADLAVFRPSTGGWFWLNSSNNTFSATFFGQNGDLPVPGDFNGDGSADICVYRPSTGTWYQLNGTTGQYTSVNFGISEDRPVVGDFDGDGKADITLFRPSLGDWYRLNSSNGQFVAIHFGANGDKPVAADYDGDGKDDISVFRPSTGEWFRLNSSTGAFTGTQFGLNGDLPSPGDYDGDGKADIAVFRPVTGAWYLLRSTAGFTAQFFGINGDIPSPNSFVY